MKIPFLVDFTVTPCVLPTILLRIGKSLPLSLQLFTLSHEEDYTQTVLAISMSH